ncbi:tRNA 5-methoxyuridine(34)/uridine 5-oxyacetic acid(34) synthase CmoB [Robertmurraya korlensis]|uniref:class I SAM-dependent methyltransferase n=1 Tax=Robertmurraya korlensis TaxID=519977 RepID=UPI0020408DA8|nr:DUF1698 domain-containing protein [Robertmurraya korlensis]MCM3602643.1 tRNA 5-methoxyuridine(34)/uridine 5-oxyacetic acid(34) synthase CmoB [Robertmurraya korlensis]
MSRDKLIELYSVTSKHSNYQILPTKLRGILNNKELKVNTRYEDERMKYILEKIDVKGKALLDIGGNSGYFSFEMLDNGAKSVDYYEGNSNHAEFVKMAAEVVGLGNLIRVNDLYFSFETEQLRDKYDVVLLLNVLHHIGDDYGDEGIAIEKAKLTILKQLNNMASITKVIVFQLGFNWKGDRHLGLFENGTKQELIDFIKEGTDGYWDIKHIGIPIKNFLDNIEYQDLNKDNIVRQDSLGEFLNRPLFIMESLQVEM